VLRQLLNRDTTIAKYAFATVNEGDIAGTTTGSQKAGIVGVHAQFFVQCFDVDAV